MVADAGSYADDTATVRRVLAGEVVAFEEIVTRWQGPLVNLAYRYCRDRGKAEEMAQEAFLKIYRGLPRWRRESRFSTWLLSVAHNHYRSVIRRHVPPGVDLDDAMTALPAGDLRAEVHERMTADVVRRAVCSLPSKYRDVVILYYFQDKDLAEMARITRLREGTIKARLFRARKLLETKLEGLGGRENRLAEETGA